MESPVVVTARDACARQGLATLRFDFRGVGASTGRHDDGRGEQDDVRAALAELRRQVGHHAAIALAGYSFGAAMAAAVVKETEVAGLALIAPPLRLSALAPPAAVHGSLLVVVGDEDQYCPAAALEALRDSIPGATVAVIEGADHFFFGSLDAVAHAVAGWAATVAG
jgi:alpha/beta superfamily hydrolase